MGIEAMFKDYKTGGYNLESAKANEIRLNNLILLIAISYTISSFQVQKFKNKGVQEYISSCLLYTSPSPRDISGSRMPSSA